MFLFSALSIKQSHFKFLLYGGSKECIKTLQLTLDVATTMLGQITSEEKSALIFRHPENSYSVPFIVINYLPNSFCVPVSKDLASKKKKKLQVGHRLNQTSTDLSLSCSTCKVPRVSLICYGATLMKVH